MDGFLCPPYQALMLVVVKVLPRMQVLLSDNLQVLLNLDKTEVVAH
jgi:hypothetical protein